MGNAGIHSSNGSAALNAVPPGWQTPKARSLPAPARYDLMASQLTLDRTAFPAVAESIETLAPRTLAFALARNSLLAALLAAPLAFGAVQPWAWGALAVAAFFLLLAWAIACVRQGCLRIAGSPLFLPAGFIFLLGMIQFAGHLTMDSISTREALLKLSTDLILFFLAGQLFIPPASASTPQPRSGTRPGKTPIAGTGSDILSTPALRWGLVIYTFLLSLFAIFQFFSSEGLIYWAVKSPGWTFGPYVNHNHYAGLMEMLIPLSVASALPALRKHPSAAVVGCLILIPGASLLLSGSRGGFISLLGEALLAAVLVFWFGPRRARGLTAAGGRRRNSRRRAVILLDGAASHCRAAGEDGRRHASSRGGIEQPVGGRPTTPWGFCATIRGWAQAWAVLPRSSRVIRASRATFCGTTPTTTMRRPLRKRDLPAERAS